MDGKAISLVGLEPSFGFGDRIGLGTPGHVEAMRDSGKGITPVFPQQSVREMERTGRSPAQVMEDALRGMRQSGWTAPSGADADHLKTRADAERTASAGFRWFTIDPSDHVDPKADDYDTGTLRAKFAEIEGDIDWFGQYNDRTVSLLSGTEIAFDEETVMRAAVKYGTALNRALELAGYIESICPEHEIEFSVDESEQPTSLAEHYIVAEQILRRGMKMKSLAPRFIGEMEKGVDYIGNLEALGKSLENHSAIAEVLGPYKLSLHSGSDKISMYPHIAKATKGRFHVKTAGTSYLEALRVAAVEDAALFRRICSFSYKRYETDKATYHVHAELKNLPEPGTVSSLKELERIYLGLWEEVAEGEGFSNPGRQVLHCAFGSVLTEPELSRELKNCLSENAETYKEFLSLHFRKHLNALKKGMAQ